MPIKHFALREGGRRLAAHGLALREVSFEDAQLVRRLRRLLAGAREVGPVDLFKPVPPEKISMAALARNENRIL